MGKYGPWQPGDDLESPHMGNLYIKNLVNRDVDEHDRHLALSRISQDWIDEMSMMTHPFSDKEKAMMSFIINMLVEEGPDEKIQSMSSTVGDVQAIVGDIIRDHIEYQLNVLPSDAHLKDSYQSIANQFADDPRQTGLPPMQRIPVAARRIYKRLMDVEFELSNTSHSENVMMGRKPELPITDIDLDDRSDRSTWFLGIFIYYTLKEREVRNHFLVTRGLRLRTVINRSVK